MGYETGIEWADATYSPWEGCVRVSEACDNCYAERRDAWLNPVHNDAGETVGGLHWGKGSTRRRMSDKYLRRPLAWDRKAAETGITRRVFSGSLCDVFEHHPDVAEWQLDLLDLIAATPNLIWMLLTKRARRIGPTIRRWERERGGVWPLPNVWLGVTAETFDRGGQRIPHLLEVPAAVHFVSAEPLLGAVGLSDLSGVDWVITGGESGPRARPLSPRLAEHTQQAVKRAGAAFFHKQNGEWEPGEIHSSPADWAAGRIEWSSPTSPARSVVDEGMIPKPWEIVNAQRRLDVESDLDPETTRELQRVARSRLVMWDQGSPLLMVRASNKTTGRLIAGREWSELPVPRTGPGSSTSDLRI